MRRLAFRHLVLAILVAVVVALGWAAPAAAHNSLVSSDPADGAVLDVAPTQIAFVFDRSVPLDSMTAQYIDPIGARTELTGLVHGPNGDTDVIATLPAVLPAGASTIRWRLVGPDGHPITGRIGLTINAAVAPTTQPVTGQPGPAAPSATTTAPSPPPRPPTPSTPTTMRSARRAQLGGSSGMAPTSRS